MTFQNPAQDVVELDRERARRLLRLPAGRRRDRHEQRQHREAEGHDDEDRKGLWGKFHGEMGSDLPERAKYTICPPVDEATLTSLLQRVADGERSVQQALTDLRDLPFEDIGSAKIDHHRELRTGQAEAVFGPGKTPDEVRDAAAALSRRTAGAGFVTRATPEQFAAVHEVLPDAVFGERSRLIVAREAANRARLGGAAVVSAGTSDAPVAEEAWMTLGALGAEVDRIADVGVAGVHRLLEHRERIESA